jgi:flagellar protein FlaG
MTQASQASSSTKAAATHGRSQYPRPEAGPQYKLPNESEINDMVEQVNRRLEPRSINMTYKRHEGTDRYFLTIYNSDTKEVIREIPSEWSLDLLATLWEMTGLFMNKKG